MSNAPWYAGLVLVVVFMTTTVVSQLSHDASPAATFCAAAERQGVPCQTGPKYDAQVVTLTDSTGSPQAYLVISQGTKTIGAIPLQ